MAKVMRPSPTTRPFCRVIFTIALGILHALPSNSLSETNPRVSEIRSRMAQLEQELDQLQSELDAIESESEAATTPGSPSEPRLPRGPLRKRWERSIDNEKDPYIILLDTNINFLSDLQLHGRIHLQAGHVHPLTNHLSDYSTAEFRRLRLGVSGVLWKQLRFVINANVLQEDADTQDAYLGYELWENIALRAGLMKTRFAYEEVMSSNDLMVVERSSVNNNTAANDAVGFAIHGNPGLFSYFAGVFDEGKNVNNPDNFDADTLYNVSIGYHPGRTIEHIDTLGFRLDFLHNANIDEGRNPFELLTSLNAEYESGPWGLYADTIYGRGIAMGHFYGFYLTPYYRFAERWEAVTRLQYIDSNMPNVVGAQNRYERDVPGLTNREGDAYEALYLGLNYYFNKGLKVMFGAEYAKLRDTMTGDGGDYEGVTLYTALRYFF